VIFLTCQLLIQLPGLRLIHPPRLIQLDAGTPSAIDPYTGIGFRQRGNPGASGNYCHDRRSRPLPKALQKQEAIERFASLSGDNIFIGCSVAPQTPKPSGRGEDTKVSKLSGS